VSVLESFAQMGAIEPPVTSVIQPSTGQSVSSPAASWQAAVKICEPPGATLAAEGDSTQSLASG